MPAYRYGRGVRSSLAQSGASGRLRISSRVLPMNRLAISAQTRSPSRSNSSGPGWMPYPVSGQHRGGGVGGQPEGEHRHQGPRGRGVVAGLGPGDALDGAAELPLVLGQALLGDVGQERRDLGPAGRQRPEREAERGATQPGPPRAREVLAAHERPAGRDDVGRAVAQVGGDPQGLADGENPDGHHHVDAVGQLRMPKVSRCWPVCWSMPIRPMVRPMASEAKPRIRDARARP